jgi:hypothetical protein
VITPDRLSPSPQRVGEGEAGASSLGGATGAGGIGGAGEEEVSPSNQIASGLAALSLASEPETKIVTETLFGPLPAWQRRLNAAVGPDAQLELVRC